MAAVITGLYGPAYDYPHRPNGATKTAMIATIPRAGSTHFCTELWRTGQMGAPMEYLNFLNRIQDLVPRVGGGNISLYWERIKTLRTTPNGIFSYKTFPQDFQQIEARCANLIDQINPDYVIYLTRKDKLKQAISYSRAHQTNAWFADVEDKVPPSYDRTSIDNALRWIYQLENRWENLFHSTSCDPLRLTYEELLDDTEGCVSKVLRFCNLEEGADTKVHIPPMAIQRDTITDDWLSRYNSEK